MRLKNAYPKAFLCIFVTKKPSGLNAFMVIRYIKDNKVDLEVYSVRIQLNNFQQLVIFRG